MASHSTRAREAHGTTGPRRMALSDPERAHVSARVEGESKGQTSAPGTEPCVVYILKCADGSFYVGSTSDVAERERIHNEGSVTKRGGAITRASVRC
ncbi:MAG: GIY-YIG nuclease family protein [Acidobacteriota bacterium]